MLLKVVITVARFFLTKLYTYTDTEEEVQKKNPETQQPFFFLLVFHIDHKFKCSGTQQFPRKK